MLVVRINHGRACAASLLLYTGRVLQLFQYSGSRADVAGHLAGGGNAKAISQDSVAGGSRGTDDHFQRNGKGKGKGKGKAKGKSRAAEPLTVEGFEENEDDDEYQETRETEEMSMDTAEIEEEDGVDDDSESSSGKMDHDQESSAGAGVAVAGQEQDRGHAMLKSRLVDVSLRGLVAMEDGAVMVREGPITCY